MVSCRSIYTCRVISYDQKGEVKNMAELETYRRMVERIAKQLEYPPKIIKNLRKAKTENELSQIMAEARRHLK